MNPLNDVLTVVEILRCYRDLHKVYSDVLQDISKIIVHSANFGMTDVPSQMILDVLDRNQERIKVINQRLETVGANFGISK